jgi:hypothetical protein
MERVFREAESEGALEPEAPTDFAPYEDESDKLFVGKEFTLDEFERWFAVQKLGGRPYNAVGFHHTEAPTASEWAGMRSLNFIFFEWYEKKHGWPRGVGPHFWLYSGEGPYSPGVPRVYVATHPAHDGIGIIDRNERWAHLECAHNGDHAEFSDAFKRAAGRLLGIICRPNQHVAREIPLTFVRNGGVDNPGQPLGIMYHRDQNPNWNPNDPNNSWPKTCPGLRVTHENLDPDLIRHARNGRTVPKKPKVVAETGSLVAAMGAIARDAPRRNAGGNARQLTTGKTYKTTGFTDDGESIDGSPRWYRLTNRKWVHASGGSYTVGAGGGVPGFVERAGQLRVGAAGASPRPGPSRESGDPLGHLEAGTVHAVDGLTDKGQKIQDSARWYRLAGKKGWVHASGGVVSDGGGPASKLPKAGGAWETLDEMNDEIAEAGEKTGVPPHLIKAMLAREGSFGKDWGKPPVFFPGRPSEVLPFNGIFRSTAESRGIDFDRMCRDRPYAIWAMGEVLRQIKEQQADTPGFTVWDDVAGFYFAGPNWNDPDWGDELGNTVKSYKFHSEGGVIVRMKKLDALRR